MWEEGGGEPFLPLLSPPPLPDAWVTTQLPMISEWVSHLGEEGCEVWWGGLLLTSVQHFCSESIFF